MLRQKSIEKKTCLTGKKIKQEEKFTCSQVSTKYLKLIKRSFQETIYEKKVSILALIFKKLECIIYEQKVDVIEHLSLFLYTEFFLMNFSFGNNISIAIQI